MDAMPSYSSFTHYFVINIPSPDTCNEKKIWFLHAFSNFMVFFFMFYKKRLSNKNSIIKVHQQSVLNMRNIILCLKDDTLTTLTHCINWTKTKVRANTWMNQFEMVGTKIENFTRFYSLNWEYCTQEMNDSSQMRTLSDVNHC